MSIGPKTELDEPMVEEEVEELERLGWHVTLSRTTADDRSTIWVTTNKIVIRRMDGDGQPQYYTYLLTAYTLAEAMAEAEALAKRVEAEGPP